MAREFIRQLSDFSLWADFAKEVRAGSKTCPKQISDEILKDNAMSVYDRQRPEIERRIAGALTLIRRIDDFHAITFPPRIIEACGFQANQTPQNAILFDTTLRALHYDVVPTSNADVNALAIRMAQGRFISFDKRSVIEYIRNEIKASKWARTDVFREHAPTAGKLMALHWRDRYLELDHPSS